MALYSACRLARKGLAAVRVAQGRETNAQRRAGGAGIRRQLVDATAQTFGDFPRRSRVAADQQHGELIAGVTKHLIGVAYTGPQHAGHLLQYPVARAVPGPIIDVLQVVDVDHQQRQVSVIPLGTADLAGQCVVENAPVGKPGQRVCGRVMLGTPVQQSIAQRVDDHADQLLQHRQFRIFEALAAGDAQRAQGYFLDLQLVGAGMATTRAVSNGMPLTGKLVPKTEAVVRQDLAKAAREVIDQRIQIEMPRQGRGQLERVTGQINRFAPGRLCLRRCRCRLWVIGQNIDQLHVLLCP